MRRLLNYLFAGVVLLVLALASYLYWFSITRLTPQEVIYVVQPGATLSGFAQQLYDQGVLPDSHSLVWLAYLKGQQRHLKAGEYRFRKGITAPRLLEQVVSGRVVEYPLTIIEGWTFKQMLENPAPEDWLMFSRTYDAQRYSPLNQCLTFIVILVSNDDLNRRIVVVWQIVIHLDPGEG